MTTLTFTESRAMSALLVFEDEDTLTVQAMERRMQQLTALVGILSVPEDTLVRYEKVESQAIGPAGSSPGIRSIAIARREAMNAGRSTRIESIDFHSPMTIGILVTAGSLLAGRLVKLASALSALRRQFSEDSLAVTRNKLEKQRVQRQARIEQEVDERDLAYRAAIWLAFEGTRNPSASPTDPLPVLEPLLGRV